MLESFTKIEAAFVEVPTKTAVIVNSFLSSLRIPRIRSSFESHLKNDLYQIFSEFLVEIKSCCTMYVVTFFLYVIAKDD